MKFSKKIRQDSIYKNSSSKITNPKSLKFQNYVGKKNTNVKSCFNKPYDSFPVIIGDIFSKK